jgi:hypothetical protein
MIEFVEKSKASICNSASKGLSIVDQNANRIAATSRLKTANRPVI